MSNIVRVARLLLGIIFVVFGLNGFHIFIPVPPFHPFMQILVASGYIYFIKTTEILAGTLLLANRGVVLSLILLGADIANIVAYHLLLDHRNWPIVPVITALYAVVVWHVHAELLLAKAGGSNCKPRGIPTLVTRAQRKWKGRSAAEVCTSEARKIGERLVGARGQRSERTEYLVYRSDRRHGLHHGGEQLAFPALA